ncbi:MAG: YibE/F family protein [Minisyncoccota bacterium]
MMSLALKRVCIAFFIFSFLPLFALAQENSGEYIKGRVTAVLNERTETVESTNAVATVQQLRIELLESSKKGAVIELENDFILLKTGDVVFLLHTVDADGSESYIIKEKDRTLPLILLAALFVAAVIAFGGFQGVRAILSLMGSFFVILYFLIPSLLQGYPPLITSGIVAAAILFFAIFLTHGFNRESLAAFSGTIISVALTLGLAFFSVNLLGLTGFASEEAVMINIHNAIRLDFSGLLLGGILIGVLGVLDDIAITQVAVVRELYRTSEQLTAREVYKKALNVGKEHVSALVNTLVLAYTGAALPLLLVFYASDLRLDLILNQEVFSTEIVRTIIGSIGLIMTVPITTFLAVMMLKNYKGNHVHHHSH